MIAAAIALVVSAAIDAADAARPGFKGLYPGMRAADLPASLTMTRIGEREGYLGDDYVQVHVGSDTVTQIVVVYSASPSGSTPRIDRKLSLADAWRIHAVSKEVPPFGLYVAYLQRVEGLIDTKHWIAYKLTFPKPEFNRDAPALFDPGTRVEQVIYALDRVELAFNHQPIASRALLQRIAEAYRSAVGQ